MSPSKQRGGGPRRTKPPLSIFHTTLWSYPSQDYGDAKHGDKHYVGATPSWVIWQLLSRYTRENDLVLDPMCGSGTTLDVARELGRRAIGYDVAPTREGVFRADARKLPIEDGKADFVFVDPPYSTHVDYSEDPACIGKLDALAPGDDGRVGAEYYDAMERVVRECRRALKDRRYMALYVSDSFKKRKTASGAPSFAPVGFELFSILRAHFTPADIVCVTRGSEKLGRGNWRKAAIDGNYFLRGFNYLFIMKKDARRSA